MKLLFCRGLSHQPKADSTPLQITFFMASRQVKIYSSITEIPAERWDSILDPVHVFHTHRFIHTVELSGVENSRCRPVCFYEDQELVATAVLSAFRVDLGIFLGEKIKKRIQAVQQTFPRFLKPNILFCGLPVSLGQTNLIISREESIDWVLKALDEKMQQVPGRRVSGIWHLKNLTKKTLSSSRTFRSWDTLQATVFPTWIWTSAGLPLMIIYQN